MKGEIDAKIKYFGTDFTDIYEFIDDTVIDAHDEIVGQLEQNKKAILIDFLNQVKYEKSSIQVNGRNNLLYRELGKDKYYFQGLIGVISKVIKWHPYYDSEEENEQTQEKELELCITLEIHSRFDVEVENEKKLSRPFFLATMLRHGKEFVTTGSNIEENPNDYFFDFLLVFKFADYLKTAYEKGYYRTYHTFKKNDDRLKGTIDIARHFKENIGLDNGRIAYSYREKTINNYFNHLLVETYFYIKDKFEFLFYNILESDDIILDMIKRLNNDINYPLYSHKEIISRNLSNISHPFYYEYDQLREVCLKILRDESSSIFMGNEDEVEGILYYIPDLWEDYLENYLDDSRYYMQSQFSTMIFDFNGDCKYKQETKPDYVFFADSEKERPFMILDAKFKPKWAELIKDGAWQVELAEDYNKCIRDMNSHNVHDVGIICPSNDKEASVEGYFEHNISKYNTTDKFYSFPIYVPKIASNDTYESWEKRFAEGYREMIEKIKDTIVLKKSKAADALNCDK